MSASVSLDKSLEKIESWLVSVPLYRLSMMYRLHISFLFLAMLLVQFSVVANDHGYAPIIAFSCWHLALYVFNRYTDRLEDARNFPQEAMNDYHAGVSLWLAFLLLMVGAVILFFSKMPLVYYLLSLPFVFLYGLRLPGFSRRIKDVLVIKNLYAVLACWCLPVILVEMTYARGWYFNEDIARFVLLLFFYIACYEVLADIKDVRGDRETGIETVAVRYGVAASRAGVCALIIVAWLISYITYDFFSYPFAALILAAVPFIGEGRPALYFHGLIFATSVAVVLYYFIFVFPLLSGFSL